MKNEKRYTAIQTEQLYTTETTISIGIFSRNHSAEII